MMRPASATSAPEIWLMSDVLPAPLGPMIACVSPASTSRFMASATGTAPKALLKFSRRSSTLSIATTCERAGVCGCARSNAAANASSGRAPSPGSASRQGQGGDALAAEHEGNLLALAPWARGSPCFAARDKRPAAAAPARRRRQALPQGIDRTGDAAPGEQHHQDQRWPEHNLPMLGEARQRLLQQQV